jgi:hypothetical protein
MQCPRCQFENMPGQARCFKCGSVLGDSGGVLVIEPPRQAGWKRPFRSVGRSVRGLMPERAAQLRGAPGSRVGESLIALRSLGVLAVEFVLGLIPGLPFVLEGQFRRIRLFWLAWLVFSCAALFLYGLAAGYLMLGLAVAIHAWLMFSHQVLGVVEGFGERVAVVLVLVFVLLAIYPWLPRTVVPGLACVRSTMAFPHYRIAVGDALLARRAPDEPKRGTIVYFDAYGYGIHGGAGGLMGGASTLGQIVGLPGDEVTLHEGGFVVNGRALDKERYPCPDWLRGREETFHLTGPRQYFVTCQYQVRRVGLPEGLVGQLCMVDRSRIQSRAFMLWSPLWRRGLLRTD